MLQLVAIILSIFSIICGWITFQRTQLPYNSEGRFFDSENAVVYHSQAIPVFAIITGLLILIALAIWQAASKNHPEQK